MRRTALSLAALVTLGSTLGTLAVAAPAQAAPDSDQQVHRQQLIASTATTAAPVQSGRISHLGSNPSQVGISGCFMKTAPIFVTSGLDSVRVYDVSDPAAPKLTGVLPNVLFENEAMNCGERRTATGIERFALIGVDLVQSSPGDIQHTNVGGGELVIVDVTDPAAPTIRSRTAGSTSTHTVACVDAWDCTYAYSAGDDKVGFSNFDLRDLDAPKEVDGDPEKAGVQPFFSPTAAHKWNFDGAGYGTHTGWGGTSLWDVTRPRRPRLVTTTGLAGQGDDPKYPGWNDFIHHNSFRPNAQNFRANAQPSLANGNVLLVTEEDYEQTDCAKAGSFQTWWVKRLDGTPSAIVPLDKVELADLGNFPLPQGAFCSAHWFDYRSNGIVAAGFYGGGTQILDVRDPRDIKTYAHSVWGLSEVWDAMWVPVYRNGKQTAARTNLVYSIDLVRGLDVYAVNVPGDDPHEVKVATLAAAAPARPAESSLLPVGVLAAGLLLSTTLGRLASRRRRTA